MLQIEKITSPFSNSYAAKAWQGGDFEKVQNANT